MTRLVAIVAFVACSVSVDAFAVVPASLHRQDRSSALRLSVIRGREAPAADGSGERQSGAAAAVREYTVTGMVLAVDPARHTVTVSHDAVRGLMDAMAMTFDVRDPKELDGARPGAIVEFTLVVTSDTSYARGLRVKRYESVEQDPLAARRLALLKRMVSGDWSSRLTVGDQVPPFTLVDQTKTPVSLAALAGKVIAVNFVYTRCALPQFCVRMSNAFSVLQRRFQARLGRDMVLLTISFDPVRDQPEVLAQYAHRWNADPAAWHFLTGDPVDVKRLCAAFGVDSFPDEGLFNHTLRTAVIDRTGRLAAVIDGNQFTAEQLGDLVETVARK